MGKIGLVSISTSMSVEDSSHHVHKNRLKGSTQIMQEIRKRGLA
jgi:hypothetical protein